MERGEKCICQHDDWWNAYGDKFEALHQGMRLTVLDRKNIFGQLFYSFEEVSDEKWFWSTGFIPLRNLN
jgi:hypothetical protein